MSRHVFFCPELTLDSRQLELASNEAHHLATVLRLRKGDEIVLMNGNGLTADAILQNVEKWHVNCQVQSVSEHRRPVPMRLYIAPPRNKNMELVIRCATELGVSRITPVLCEYGVSRPDSDKEGWRQTAIVACKQSRNPYLPQMDAPLPFADALANCHETSFLGAVPASGASTRGEVTMTPEGFALWVGPEGGFSEAETRALLEAGAVPVTVGPCILRVETAVPALLGAIYAAYLPR